MPERLLVTLRMAPADRAVLTSALSGRVDVRFAEPSVIEESDLRWATVVFGSVLPAERLVPHARLTWIHVPASGIEPYERLANLRPDLRVTHAPGLNAEAVAEHGLAILFALERRLAELYVAQQRRGWVRDVYMRAAPRLIGNMEAHVLGYGPLAKALIAKLAILGAGVTAYRREAAGCDPHVRRFRALRDLPNEVASADVVIGLLPERPQTIQLIDGDVLDAMQQGALLINLGRGTLLDEQALVRRLRDGHIGGAALDVFATEPLPADSALWSLPNVIITPHIGGQFRGNRRAQIRQFLDLLNDTL